MRWVIVAQLKPEPHCPTVYGTWETAGAAEEQFARWERRIERTLGGDYDGIHMSVEPMRGRSADCFEGDFERAIGVELVR